MPLLFGQPVTITIPTPGLHTVYIKNVGMTYADIDQITLLPPVQRLSAGSNAEDNINLTYTGTWTPQVLAGAIGGTRTYTSQDGATLKFDIDNTVSRIVIYRTTYIAGVYGTVYIYLDDPTMASAPFAIMNNTTAALLLGQPFFLTIPTPGNHNITIRNVGATYSDIDNIKLLDVAPTLTTAGVYEK